MIFSSQADTWLQQLSTRKRGSVKPASLATFKWSVKRLNALLGSTDLADVHNGTARAIVEQFVREDLSPATINLLLTVLKAIVASYVNPVTGEPIYQRVWRSEHIDAPQITHQDQPIYTRGEIETMLKVGDERARAFITFAAGTGMRIGEILDCRINSDTATSLDLENRVVHVRTSRWGNRSQAPKTAAAVRPIDLYTPLVKILTAFVGDRRGGFLFATREGQPLCPTSLRRQLAPIGAASFHAYRRFRITLLRSSLVPEDLIRLYTGHSAASVTDRYSKIENQLDVRRRFCEEVGLGFEVPDAQQPGSEAVMTNEMCYDSVS